MTSRDYFDYRVRLAKRLDRIRRKWSSQRICPALYNRLWAKIEALNRNAWEAAGRPPVA